MSRCVSVRYEDGDCLRETAAFVDMLAALLHELAIWVGGITLLTCQLLFYKSLLLVVIILLVLYCAKNI
ncbi:hypothetical protein GMJAKD_00155 [Candidatus Electrothrix aarhusensis]